MLGGVGQDLADDQVDLLAGKQVADLVAALGAIDQPAALAITAALALAACGSDDDSADDAASSPATTEAMSDDEMSDDEGADQRLLVTYDAALDAELAGMKQIITGYEQRTLYKLTG